MKRLKLILIVLLIALLACSTLTGGNETNGNDGDNTPQDARNNNPGTGEESTVEEETSSQSALTVESQIDTASACYNAFYPVNQQRVWTYQSYLAGQSPTQFTIATTEVSEDSLTSTMTFPEFSSTVHWHCGPDGLFSSEFAQFNFAMMPGFDIETVSYDGLTLPEESLWEVGYSWESSYEINISMEFEGIALDTNVTTTMNSTIIAIEEVTVPAGTFPEAYHVLVNGLINFDMMGTSIQVPLESSTWYVKDVGMVKSVSTDEIGESTIELISIE